MDVNEKSWDIFIRAWKNGEPKIKVLYFLFDRIPQLTYPDGEKSYNESVNRFGEDRLLSPHNIWRECCHFAFGFLISLPFMRMEWKNWVCLGIYILFQLKEILLDVRVDQKGQVRLKNFVDAVAWGCGSSMILFI